MCVLGYLCVCVCVLPTHSVGRGASVLGSCFSLTFSVQDFLQDVATKPVTDSLPLSPSLSLCLCLPRLSLSSQKTKRTREKKTQREKEGKKSAFNLLRAAWLVLPRWVLAPIGVLVGCAKRLFKTTQIKLINKGSSSGTLAWFWNTRDLVVCFFTMSLLFVRSKKWIVVLLPSVLKLFWSCFEVVFGSVCVCDMCLLACVCVC